MLLGEFSHMEKFIKSLIQMVCVSHYFIMAAGL